MISVIILKNDFNDASVFEALVSDFGYCGKDIENIDSIEIESESDLTNMTIEFFA